MNYFECKYCLKKFKRESFFKKHQCEQMVKEKLMQKTVGLNAYGFYCDWLKLMKFKTHGREQFMDSRLFKPFINFARFSTRMALPAKDKFLEHMVELKIHPKDWTNTLVYDHYIECLDHLLTPEEHFDISVDTIYELSKIYECKPNEIFLFMEPADIIRIVQAKKLSPWFLSNSRAYKKFVSVELTREQQILLEKYVNPVKWDQIFEDNPKEVARFSKRVKELGL